MHASAFLLGAISLAATTAATPLHKFRINAATVANYTWTVTDWEASCAEDCTYSQLSFSSITPAAKLTNPPKKGFNVSAPAFKTSVPAFNASCAGTGIGASYAVCKGPAAGQAVAAKLLPASTNETAKLAVSYEFLDPNAV